MYSLHPFFISHAFATHTDSRTIGDLRPFTETLLLAISGFCGLIPSFRKYVVFYIGRIPNEY